MLLLICVPDTSTAQNSFKYSASEWTMGAIAAPVEACSMQIGPSMLRPYMHRCRNSTYLQCFLKRKL